MSIIYNKNISVFCKSCTVARAKCHLKKKCTFAHSLHMIKPITCKYGDCCVWRELTCNKIHEAETIDEYAFRVGFRGKGGIARLEEMALSRMIVKKLSRCRPIDHEVNIGATIMKKWGWVPGTGLGANLQGIVEPVLPISSSTKMLNEKQSKKNSMVPIFFIKSTGGIENSLDKLTL